MDQNHHIAAPGDLAARSLVLSLIGIIVPFALPIAGIITAHIALHRIKQNPALVNSHGVALAGLIIGYFFAVLDILVLTSFIGLAILGSVLANR